MRIVAGQFKGKKLYAGNDLSIRPITNRLKEIIFSVLNDFFYEQKVLDLFSGSGSLGIEALSRGAGHVTFVEKEDSSIRVLKKNIDQLKIDPKLIKLTKSDVLKYISESINTYNLIFSDPPFKFSSLQKMIDHIFAGKILEENGLLVVHHEIDNLIKKDNVPYLLLQQKKIGRSLLSFIIKETTHV